MGEQVSDSAAATPASTTASAVSTAPTTTASSLVTYKDAGCWGDGFYALCSGYKLDTSGDVVHPGASSCSYSCCDTVQHGGGGDARCWYGNVVFELCCEQVSDSAHDGSSYMRDGSSYVHDGSSYMRDGSSYMRDGSSYMRDGS